MSSTYCQLKPISDISGITVLVGNNIISEKFYFQVGPTPPPEFFNLGGIYLQRTVSCVIQTFDRLYAQQYAINPKLPDPFNNRTMNIYVQQMSYRQQQYYQQLITLFQKIYAYNAAAYYLAAANNTIPIYYTCKTASELSQWKESVPLILKLYDVTPDYPVNSIFFLPFPPFC
jgi:hypothetical protein